MALIRGSNPIWFEVDLTAHAFDDTFYLFILENEIPYMPATVWQDPFGNVPWSNPIRFLANGTLPNNIYYDPDVVYRLEFRQGNTQADPLIYLVENYSPGSGGSTPVDDVSFSTDNQITNPQFALINFTSPLTFTGISTQVINVAPGWELNLTGTGTVILSQVKLDSTITDPTNASYALQIQLSGSWSNAYLSQRFTQNGILWANTFVSSSIMAVSGSGIQHISAELKDSQGNTLATVLNNVPLTLTFVEYRDVGQLLASTNTDQPPGAYIEYQLLLPNNCDITVSSIQLVSGDIDITYPYEQTTIERQIDHTYHYEYPIVPIGTVINFGGFNSPSHYLLCNGAAYNRITYSQLFDVITNVETVTLTSSMATFTVADGSIYRVGMGLEGTGIPAFTTIIAISTNTITMSSVATVSGSEVVRFYAAAPIFQETVTLTSAMSTFTTANPANYHMGMAITGNGIPAATIVSNIVSTTVTISNAATITGSSVVTIYGVGNGDGSTTFNVYNLTDQVIAGSGGVIFGVTGSGLGAQGGAASYVLQANDLPAHTHANPSPSTGFAVLVTPPAGTFAGVAGNSLATASATGNNTTTNNAVSLVQQTTLMKPYIRFE